MCKIFFQRVNFCKFSNLHGQKLLAHETCQQKFGRARGFMNELTPEIESCIEER